jgi:hypothetical protein
MMEPLAGQLLIAITLASLCALNVAEGHPGMSPHLHRNGATLVIDPGATDAELRALAPDPTITEVALLVPPNALRSALTASGLAALGRWHELRVVRLSGSAADDRTLAALAALKHLRVLDLMNTQVTAKGLAHITALAALRELWLDGLRTGDQATTAIATLGKLRVLRFYRAPLTDAGVERLAALTQLEELHLGESAISDRALIAIGRLTHLRQLDVRAPVTGLGLRALRGLTELRWLALGKQVDDSGIAELAALTRLENLYLSGASITDVGAARLRTLVHLSVLDLSDTQVTDEGVASILPLTTLTELRLDGTRITDATLDRIATMPASPPRALNRLSVARTPITPAALARLTLRHSDLRIEGLDASQRVLAWLAEAPFEAPTPDSSDFSYEDWLRRGRSTYYAEETLRSLVEVPVADPPDLVRAHAAHALGWIGTRGSQLSILALLRALGGQDAHVRAEVAAALGRLGDARVLPTLEQLASDPREDDNVRANAYVALGNLGDARAEKQLRQGTLETNAFLRSSAQEGLRLLHAKH